MLFLALYRVFNNMETLSFDNPEETDIISRSPTAAQVIYIYIYDQGWIMNLCGNKANEIMGLSLTGVSYFK